MSIPINIEKLLSGTVVEDDTIPEDGKDKLVEGW